MRRMLACLLAVLMITGMLCACAAAPETETNAKGIRIVCTIFPIYDWTREILGSHMAENDVTMLLKNGTDMHSYQPSAQDMIQVSACDLFIYVGGESDRWVEDALQEAANSDRIVLNLLDVLGGAAKEEELSEGMEKEADSAEEGETAYDEHVWLSVKNAMRFCAAIEKALASLDPSNAADYEANARAYMQELTTLDEAYAQAVSDAQQKTLLFGDRFPFRYLTEDYGIAYYAAFAGCSAETEASFGTIAFLAEKVDELGLPAVLTIEGAQHAIAKTIVQSTRDKDQAVLTLDSMQSVTQEDMQQGASYLSIMEENLAVLWEALR
ncbi:MAG: metal ABC transporter substrate-binding protein [Clostridia bacterium]|nr:metal ABC transporter substrate-binding protein [Clostridia bacterium]